MKRFWQRLKRNERGATVIEYGLLVGIISIALLLSAQFLADEVNALWDSVTSTFTAA